MELKPYIVKFSKHENKFPASFLFFAFLTTLFVTDFVWLRKISSEQVCETMDSLCTISFLSNPLRYSQWICPIGLCRLCSWRNAISSKPRPWISSCLFNNEKAIIESLFKINRQPKMRLRRMFTQKFKTLPLFYKIKFEARP